MKDQEQLIIESHKFYEMHKLTGEYETRVVSEILSIERLQSGLKEIGLRATLFDRVPIPKKDSITIGQKKPGQLITTIKLLYRLGPNDTTAKCTEPSPVFFFAFRHYEDKLREYRGELLAFCLKAEEYGNTFKVESIYEILIGGVYAIRSHVDSGEFVRGRVTKLNLISGKVTYWAIDSAYFGECEASDMLVLNEECVNWEMLAVPAIFDSDPQPESLNKFAGASGIAKRFCLAKVTQPKFAYDYLPRKIVLV